MDIAFFLRVFLLYPASGALALYFGFAEFDEASGILTIDVNAAGAFIAAIVWGGGSGSTFLFSRFMKARGGAT